MSTTARPGSRDDSLILDTRQLRRTPGAILAVSRTAILPRDIGVELICLPQGGEITLDLVLTCVDEGILVSGAVEGQARVECARCLGEFDAEVSTDLTEMYAYEDAASAAGAEHDEVRLLDRDLLDLEPALVDAFGLQFPLAPTCEALGLERCIEPETPEPDGVSGHGQARIDPRWAGLAEKFGSPASDESAVDRP